jgi:tripartite-type tricarboxylate transporter receptor subunit TctC
MKKRFFSRTMVLAVLALLVLSFGTPGIQAQQKFPDRPMTIICPWGAGGGTDAVARMLAVLMEKDLGQPVTVVNRTGGSGAVGHTAGATAAPNGYTMTITTVEITMMHWMGLTPLTYKEFKGASLVNIDSAAMFVRTDAPWKTLQELLADVKANPGKIKASGTGKGGIWDLARAGLLKAAGLSPNDMPWVPSNGAAPALQELMAGGIPVVSCSLPEAASLIEAKKVRPLVVMADTRSDMYPDLPTTKELGMNWTMGAWRGISVPKNTPADIVAVIERSLKKAVEDPQFKKFMNEKGYGILYKSAADFDKFMAVEDGIKGAIMKEAGIVQ